MLKQNLLKAATLTVIVCCLMLSVACDSTPAKDDAEQIPYQTNEKTENGESAAVSSAATSESPTNVTSPESPSDVIAKITGAADETGIYSIVLTLSDKAADKGTIEMVYYGPKDSPQAEDIVNTFRIEYYREDAGTFEVQTFSNGEVYQNLHHQSKVKVNNTFGATVRAGNVIISYTPDDGITKEIYRADAGQFYVPTK